LGAVAEVAASGRFGGDGVRSIDGVGPVVPDAFDVGFEDMSKSGNLLGGDIEFKESGNEGDIWFIVFPRLYHSFFAQRIDFVAHFGVPVDFG